MKRMSSYLLVCLAVIAFLGVAAQAQVPTWQPNTAYATGAMVQYNGASYRCLQAHTSQIGWQPPKVLSLWAGLNSYYSALDLGSLGGTTQAFGINNESIAVGQSTFPSSTIPQAFASLSGQSGLVCSFNPTTPGIASAVADDLWLNVVGACSGHAFMYSLRTGVPTDLGSILDTAASGANSINSQDQVVGWYNTATAPATANHAFVWTGGIFTDLGTLGGCCSSATDINNNGQIVGTASDNDNDPHGFLYNNGQMIDLGENVQPFSINNLAQVAGQLPSAHAFLYSNGQFTDLGTLGPNGTSVAYSVNDFDQAVGDAYIPSLRTTRAFLYSGNTMQDLNGLVPPSLGTTLYDARGINDSAAIVANATNGHAYLLTPSVPSWQPGIAYLPGQVVTFNGNPFFGYQCLQSHVSQAGWTPPTTPSLWTPVACAANIPLAGCPEGGSQPVGVFYHTN